MTTDVAAAPSDLETTVVRRWWSRTNAVENAHFNTCVRFRRYHQMLGCVAIVLSTMLSLLASSTSAEIVDAFPLLKTWHLKDILIILVPVMTALLSFLRFDERSSLHHNAGARFAALKRQLQLLDATWANGGDESETQRRLLKICEKWDELTLQAPALYRADWRILIGKSEQQVGDVARHVRLADRALGV